MVVISVKRTHEHGRIGAIARAEACHSHHARATREGKGTQQRGGPAEPSNWIAPPEEYTAHTLVGTWGLRALIERRSRIEMDTMGMHVMDHGRRPNAHA